MMPNRIRQRLAGAHSRPLLQWLWLLPVVLLLLPPARAEEPAPQAPGPAMPQNGHVEMPPTALAALVTEAERNNPQIVAARHAWRAATQLPSQVSTLPDPEVVVQQFAVGSPRPFAGFSNSDFAYIGFGVSQEFPYPGKLRLKGEIASRDVASARDNEETVRRSVVEQLKATYFELAYVQQTLEILHRDDQLLEQIEQIARARYRVGQGNQQDVLKAQLERTKLLRELETRRQDVGVL